MAFRGYCCHESKPRRLFPWHEILHWSEVSYSGLRGFALELTKLSLALIELKIAISQIILNFNPGKTTDEELEFEEYVGLSSPKTPVGVTLY